MKDSITAHPALFRHAVVRSARELVTEYSLRLEGMPCEIRVRLYADVDGRWYEAEQNYFLQAPGMKEPAVPETQRYASVEEAIKEVLASFTQGYEEAVAAGHEPSDTWLMPAD